MRQSKHNQRHNHNRPFFPQNLYARILDFVRPMTWMLPILLRICMGKFVTLLNLNSFNILNGGTSDCCHFIADLGVLLLLYRHLFCVRKLLALLNAQIHIET